MEKNEKNNLEIFIEWVAGTFDKDSNVSSKRISGVLMILWSLIASTYYIYKSFHGTDADPSAQTLIQFIIVTGAGLLGAGTILERLGKKDKDQ